MTPDLIHKLQIAATPPTINGSTADAIRRIRVLLDKAGVDPFDAVVRLSRQSSGLTRPSKKSQTDDLPEAVENGQPDPRADGWNIEAIAATLASMAPMPTPADWGRLARHFHVAADRAKWPATGSELTQAIQRLRRNGKMSDGQLVAVAGFVEALFSGR